MKKTIFVLMLVFAMILSGCSINLTDSSKQNEKKTQTKTKTNEGTQNENVVTSKFATLSDPELLTYVEDNVYQSVLDNIDSEEYFVENIQAIYISQEYIDELTYNSQENVFFGYTLSDLNRQFEGKKYVFNVDDKGQTKIEAFEEYDDTYDQIIKNVAIGTGVILLCVTVSVVTAGAGAPAVAMIFAGAAKTGTAFALSSAAIGGTISTAVSYSQTGDLEESLKEGALEASEEFKWGAIVGSISGGSGTAFKLKGATLNGLTMNEAATIQKNSKYPIEVIKMIKSTKEGDIYYKEAGLIAKTVNGKTALVKEFSPEVLNFERKAGGKIMTNLEAMEKGYAAIDPSTGKAFELHHVGQTVDSPLAILSKAEHTGKTNNSILHDSNIKDGKGVHSLLDNAKWRKQTQEFWKAMADFY